nr:signal peptidase I [Candidatus Formimonas warabiya]
MGRGNIVIYKNEKDKMLVSRVAALEGETIEIKDGSVYINGAITDDSKLMSIHYDGLGTYGIPGRPYKIPDNSIFVLGDNTVNSIDSRVNGAIPVEQVVGVGYKIIWPFKKEAKI